jgi:hypothetical protein
MRFFWFRACSTEAPLSRHTGNGIWRLTSSVAGGNLPRLKKNQKLGAAGGTAH